MGVFSRTMLMLTMAWLVGLFVTFMFMNGSSEPTWREKFVGEANVRRAIAYRYVDIMGGSVAERGHQSGLDSSNASLAAESIGAAPWGLPDEGQSGGSTDALPGAKVPPANSLLKEEERSGQQQNDNFELAKQTAIQDITNLRNDIATAQRNRRIHDAKLAEVREEARKFAAEMQSYRYIIASFQQKVFNLDYEIQRVSIEKDSLIAELAQIENDIRRINEQAMSLEDSYYEFTKAYDRTIKILAWYEQADPNLRLMADTAGPTWLRGKVVAVGEDPNTGVVSISLGRHEKVQVNQVFTIYRNDKFVARMVVEHVSHNRATGRLFEEYRGRVFVVEGDSVKTAEVFGGALLRR